MSTGTFIAIYLPIIVVFLIIIPNGKRMMFMVKMMRKRRGRPIMSNVLVQSCIGKICTISTGSYGSAYTKVLVQEVVDNWLKVEAKGKTDLINIDFIQNIKIISEA